MSIWHSYGHTGMHIVAIEILKYCNPYCSIAILHTCARIGTVRTHVHSSTRVRTRVLYFNIAIPVLGVPTGTRVLEYQYRY